MFHLMENPILDGNNNKMAKVALLHNSLNESFVSYGFFPKYLSFSRVMVPYFRCLVVKYLFRANL